VLGVAPRVSSTNALLALLLIGSLVLLVFGQTVSFEFLEWDDNGYVRDNPKVLVGLTATSMVWALTSFDMANWHPLTWWSYLLDVSLFGPSPGAMHLVNVVLHGLNSSLLCWLFVRLGIRPGLALLAGAIFAVHPLHVESVAWIAERKDLLSTFFLLALLLVWDRYVRSGQRRHFWVAVLLAAFGLMAKAMLVTLPVLLLLLDAWPYARLRSPGQAWFRDRRLLARCLEKLPFLLLALVCAGLTLLAQSAGGAMRPIDEVSLMDRLLNALTAYAAYLGQTLLPVSQSFIYLFRPPSSFSAMLSVPLLGLISVYAVKQKGASLTGWLWFVVSLLPVIGLIKIGDHARADRYMYLPMIGLLLMLADARWPLGARPSLSAKGARLLIAIVATMAVAALGVTAHRYTGYWRNSETLFQRGLAIEPDNHVAHTLLAATFERNGPPQRVFDHAQAALRLAPNSVASASAAISASNVALQLGDEALATNYLSRAIAAAPNFAKPHYNRGTQLLRLGDPAGAIMYFERAIALGSRSSENYNNYGAALLQLGRRTAASAAFASAVRLDPDNRQARVNLQRSLGYRTP
jgi:tetratricopeptide (TPR) repeat protein